MWKMTPQFEQQLTTITISRTGSHELQSCLATQRGAERRKKYLCPQNGCFILLMPTFQLHTLCSTYSGDSECRIGKDVEADVTYFWPISQYMPEGTEKITYLSKKL